MSVDYTVRLRFGDDSRAAATHTNLSAVRLDGQVLWIAGDETATRGAPGRRRSGAGRPSTASETTFRLADFVRPARRRRRRGGRRRGAGPHRRTSSGRSARTACGASRSRTGTTGAKALKRLARIEGQDNRQILVRLPIAEVGRAAHAGPRGRGRRRTPAGRGPGPARQPARAAARRRAPRPRSCRSPARTTGSTSRASRSAATGVYLGLRGPVLRGWAFVLELRPYVDPDDPDRLRLRDVRRRPPVPQARARPRRPRRPRPVPGRRRPAGPGRPDDGPGRPGAGLPLARRGRAEHAGDRARRRC